MLTPSPEFPKRWADEMDGPIVAVAETASVADIVAQAAE